MGSWHCQNVLDFSSDLGQSEATIVSTEKLSHSWWEAEVAYITLTSRQAVGISLTLVVITTEVSLCWTETYCRWWRWCWTTRGHKVSPNTPSADVSDENVQLLPLLIMRKKWYSNHDWNSGHLFLIMELCTVMQCMLSFLFSLFNYQITAINNWEILRVTTVHCDILLSLIESHISLQLLLFL